MSEAEEVGSVGEEAWKLLRALSASEHGVDASIPGVATDAGATDSGAPHACPTGWCPICHVVGYVREHPEAIARVGATAAEFLASLRDLTTTPEESR